MGGNVFKDRTTSIKREHIEPTLSKYFAELKKVFPKKSNIFNIDKMKPIGSVGKKDISGDIDLAIDSKSLLDKQMSDKSIKEWGVDPVLVNDRYKKIVKRARTATPEQSRMKAFLFELADLINKKTYNIYIDDKKITNGNIFGLFPQYDEDGDKLHTGVQIDWMIGNLNWLTFSYYSSVYKGNVKGLHRTQLMVAMFTSLGLVFNHINGVKDKETQEVLAKNPTAAIKVLNDKFKFKKKLTKGILEDYFKLQEFLRSNVPKKNLDEIYDIYLKILDRTRADIPEDLQADWKKRKTKLGLTGKFLPDNSNLKESDIVIGFREFLRGE